MMIAFSQDYEELEWKPMVAVNNKPMFPCPVCTQSREVRTTKKAKPYLVCDPCGVQVFVRGPAGIEEFRRLLQHTNNEGLLIRLREMERRDRLTCSECGQEFWAEPKLIKTSVFDGSLKGFRCPNKNCDGVVAWEQTQ
jgi:transcription elongation factor Elf1